MKDEQREADIRGGGEISIGTSYAFLLDHAYLKGHATLATAVQDLARTRGFAVSVVLTDLSQLSAKQLPCLLIGPGEQAAILLTMGADSPGWALVCIPETVVPAAGSVPPPKSVPGASDSHSAPSSPAGSQLPGSATANLDDVDRKVLSMLAAPDFVRDPPGQAPLALDHGAHVITLSALEKNWKAMVLADWKALDNWDLAAQGN